MTGTVYLTVALQLGDAILGLRQPFAVQVCAPLPALRLANGHVPLQSQLAHALVRAAIDGTHTIGMGLAMGVVVLVHAVQVHHRSLCGAMTCAQHQAVSPDLFGLVLRHPVGWHEGLEALQVALLVAAKLGKEVRIAHGLPVQPARGLLATHSVSLPCPSTGVRRKAFVTDALQAQPPAQGVRSPLQAGFPLPDGSRPALARRVLPPSGPQSHLHITPKAACGTTRDDIDHAPHGGAAVLGRRSALDHLHPQDIGEQILAEIHRGARAGRDGQAVDEHQHLIAAQPLHDKGIARLAMQLLQLQPGDVGQRLFQRTGTSGLYLFMVHHFGTYWSLVTGLLDTGSGHDHIGQLCKPGDANARRLSAQNRRKRQATEAGHHQRGQ